MPGDLNIQKMTINIDRIIAKEQKHEEEETVITLKQPGMVIMDLETKLSQVQFDIKKNKVLLKANLHQNIFYLDENNQLQQESSTSLVEKIISVNGSEPGLKSKNFIQVTGKSSEIMEQGLQVKIKTSLFISIQLHRNEAREVVTGLEESKDIKVKKKNIIWENLVGQEHITENINPEISLPEKASRILKIDSKAFIKNTDIKQHNLHLKGETKYQIYYLNENEALRFHNETVPFQLTLGVPEADPEHYVYLYPQAVLQEYRLNEEDETSLKLSILINLSATVEEVAGVNLVTHVAAPGLKIDKETITGESRELETELGEMLTTTIDLHHRALEVVHLAAEIRHEAPQVENSQITVNGEIQSRLYLRDEEDTLRMHKENLPVRFSGVIPQLEPDHEIEVISSDTENITFQQVNQYQVEQSVSAKMNIKARKTVTEDVVVEISEVPLPTDITTKIYIVQQGDTLDKISWRFQVSMEELSKANPEVGEPAEISPGQKLRIPVKIG